MNKIIEKLLTEVDGDIAQLMMEDSTISNTNADGVKTYYKHWEIITDPIKTIIEWQLLRDNRK